MTFQTKVYLDSEYKDAWNRAEGWARSFDIARDKSKLQRLFVERVEGGWAVMNPGNDYNPNPIKRLAFKG